VRARYCVLALLLASGCRDVAGPATLHTTLDLGAAIATALPIQAAGQGGGQVVVDGVIGLVGCPSVSAQGTRNLDEVTLSVRVSNAGNDCPTMLHGFHYHAVLSGLEAGTYHLRVEHTGSSDAGVVAGYGGEASEVRYEQDVVVP
jgi:hypothetical protein